MKDSEYDDLYCEKGLRISHSKISELLEEANEVYDYSKKTDYGEEETVYKYGYNKE